MSNAFVRAVAGLQATVFFLSLGLAAVKPANATDDFADAAKSPINYTTPTLTSTFTCSSLTGRALNTSTTVTSAVLVAATATTPAYCDVDGIIAPSIHFDVALPVAWNQRLYGLGNGGCGGVIANYFPQRDVGLANDFAVATTDTDVENVKGDCSWAAGRPDLVRDFAYEGIHETALIAKQLLGIYYGTPALAAYYNSCSDGGHDGLEEAQKFPTDYDGIVAGSPLLGSGTVLSNAWTTSVYAKLPAGQSMTPAKLNYIASVVYAKCDALDGLADGIINDPQTCATVFNAWRDLKLCPAGTNGDTCLTLAQMKAYRKASGPVFTNGKRFYPGQPLGVEPNLLGTQIAAPGAPVTATLDYFLSDTYMKYLLPWPLTATAKFSDFTFNFDRDPDRLYPFRLMFNPTNLDMSAFFSRGGRLLTYHGWADPLITPYGTVAFYEDEMKLYGASLPSYFKFYTVPGMGHCSGGIGADQFDPMTAMINWVEGHHAPDTIVSRHIVKGNVYFTRTLCPYPQIAHYTGTGNIHSATSFACIAGPTGVPETGSNDGLEFP